MRMWQVPLPEASWGLHAQVLSQWMPMDEEPRGRGAWGRRRTPQAAASVLLLIDSHPLVLNHMVSALQCQSNPFLIIAHCLWHTVDCLVTVMTLADTAAKG